MDNTELGILWKRESKPKTEGAKGMSYLVGSINLKNIGGENKDIPIVIFKNTSKKEDKHPDLRILLSRPKGDSPQKPSPAPAEKPKAVAVAAQSSSGPDDILL